TAYRDRMADAVNGLPAQAAAAAGDSVGAAVAIAGRLGGPAGQALAGVAKTSFVEALGTAAVVASVVAVLTAILVVRAMPAGASQSRPTTEPAGAAAIPSGAGH